MQTNEASKSNVSQSNPQECWSLGFEVKGAGLDLCITKLEENRARVEWVLSAGDLEERLGSVVDTEELAAGVTGSAKILLLSFQTEVIYNHEEGHIRWKGEVCKDAGPFGEDCDKFDETFDIPFQL